MSFRTTPPPAPAAPAASRVQAGPDDGAEAVGHPRRRAILAVLAAAAFMAQLDGRPVS